MTTCDTVQAAVLDGQASGPDVAAHLAGCAECRALSEGVQGAAQLQGVTPRARPVARRAVLARASALGLVAVVLTGWGVATKGGPSTPLGLSGGTAGPSEGAAGLRGGTASAHPASDVEGTAASLTPSEVEGTALAPSAAAPSDDDARIAAEWRSLVALRDVVALDGHRDLRVDDVAYRSFGSLPAWVAPATPRPMESLGLGSSPLSLTTEE